MKKLKVIKKVLVMLVLVVMINCLSTVNKAENLPDDVFQDIPKVSPTPTPSTNPTPTPTPTTNINANNNTKLPQTGANDTIMWVVIGGCVVTAIYTYKKIKEYNV